MESYCDLFGGGTIFEAIIAGVVERPISVYSSIRQRVGLSRFINDLPNPALCISILKRQIGKIQLQKGNEGGTSKILSS
jgi:hypothetical protein